MSSVRNSLSSVGGSLFGLNLGAATPPPQDVVISSPLAFPTAAGAAAGTAAGNASATSGMNTGSTGALLPPPMSTSPPPAIQQQQQQQQQGAPAQLGMPALPAPLAPLTPLAGAAASSASSAAPSASASASAADGSASADDLGVRGSFQTGLFQENFWGETDNFAGFQVLSNHMKRGRKEVTEMLDVLKERIQIEEDYARRLAKLSRVAMDIQGFAMPDKANDEPSTLKLAWLQMRDLTNALAWRQQQFAQDIQQVVYAPLEAVRDAHKSTVADTVTTSTAAQKEFANQRALVPKLKKAYEAKCKELDSAREELNLPANVAGIKGSKNDKLVVKVARLQKEMEQANETYKAGVNRLEQLRVAWEEDMALAATLFEGLEMKRVNSAKAALEQYGDIERRLHASYASNSESLKARVAAIDAQTDIERFVATHRTGWTRPGPTLYENYYTGLMKDAVFGVPLQTHLEASGRKIPAVVERCAEFIEATGLQQVGLYRLSGRANRIRQLRTQFDKDAASVDFTAGDVQVNDVASLLKLYVRELPEPLTTFALYDGWLKAAEAPAEDQLAAMQALVAKLPEANKATLAYLLRHLRRVADQSAANKMTAPNLAIVFAPGLVRSEEDSASLRDFQAQCDVAVGLLRHCQAIFDGVPE